MQYTLINSISCIGSIVIDVVEFLINYCSTTTYDPTCTRAVNTQRTLAWRKENTGCCKKTNGRSIRYIPYNILAHILINDKIMHALCTRVCSTRIKSIVIRDCCVRNNTWYRSRVNTDTVCNCHAVLIKNNITSKHIEYYIRTGVFLYQESVWRSNRFLKIRSRLDINIYRRILETRITKINSCRLKINTALFDRCNCIAIKSRFILK